MIQKGASPRVDADKISTNVPSASLMAEPTQQQTYDTPPILSREPRKQRRAPNVITLDKTSTGSIREIVPTTYKARALKDFWATNAEPKNHAATLAEYHAENLFQKAIKYLIEQKQERTFNEYAHTIINNKTGQEMAYRYLIKHINPEIW